MQYGKVLLAAAMAWGSIGGAFAGEVAPASEEAATACLLCHSGGLTLAQWEQPALAAAIRNMRDGAAAHPQPMPELDDAGAEALAQALLEVR